MNHTSALPDGSATIACPDGTAAVVREGKGGASGTPGATGAAGPASAAGAAGAPGSPLTGDVAQLLASDLERLRIGARDRHRGALRGEEARRREPDARRAAGDDDVLVVYALFVGVAE